jgi:uncharacterized OB-fold protein
MSAPASPFDGAEPDVDSAPFWEALGRDELLVPLCHTCERRFFPALSSCPHCGGTSITQERASGHGTIESWATVHIALDPLFKAEVPYTIVAVNLDEDVRMLGRLVEGDPVPGLSVQLTPLRTGGRALPAFRAV